MYWFRTPPGVRVGRAALDEEAIKLIEEHNPDVDFDWTRILKGEAPERKSKDREDKGDRAGEPEPIESAEPGTVAPEIEPPSTAAPYVPADITVAEAKLGSEGLARLRARHSEILARISENVSDPGRKDELNSQAERLNPDTWVTDADVAVGLESYETVFESLRTAVGRRRKRRRRKPRGDRGAGAAAQPVSTEPTDAVEGKEDEDEDEQEEEI